MIKKNPVLTPPEQEQIFLPKLRTTRAISQRISVSINRDSPCQSILLLLAGRPSACRVPKYDLRKYSPSKSKIAEHIISIRGIVTALEQNDDTASKSSNSDSYKVHQ